MAPLDTLFIDAGGVLVQPGWGRVAETFARHGVPVTAVALATGEPHVRRELDTPEGIRASTDRSRSEVYFDRVLERAGVLRSPATDSAIAELAAYHAEHNLWEDVSAEVLVALRRFRGLGLRLAVVSNSNGTCRAKLGRLGLLPFFETVVDSTEEGVEKPDPRIFRVALERAGAEAGTTLHVGDLYHVDVLGARAAGLRAALLDPRNLYPDVDGLRVASLSALADWIEMDLDH
ncbi:MAG TPA: HAD-IA family hydrolase [Vicinamibacteria bacterium]